MDPPWDMNGMFFCGMDTPDPQSSGKETAGNRDENGRFCVVCNLEVFDSKVMFQFFPLRFPASHIIKGYWKPSHNCKKLPSLHLYMPLVVGWLETER